MKKFGYILFTLVLFYPGVKTFAQAIDTVCANANAKVYRVIPTPGSTYYWTVDCGKIVSPNPNADSIQVAWCNNPGTYTIKVVERNKAGCWGDTMKTQVVVNPKMHLDIYGPDQLCVGQPVWLTASGANSYQWSTGESTSNIVIHLKDTFNTIRVIGKNVCETDTANWSIRVNPRPAANFTYSPKDPIVDEAVFLNYTGTGATDWTWYITNEPAVAGSVKEYETSFREKGYHTVKLVSENQFGCSDTISYTIHIGYDSRIYVPNAFTPDGNGINDSFKAVGFNIKSIHMTIFNRWGEKLFESYGVNDAWDGTFKGQPVMDGVYIYMIDAEATDGEHYYLHGNVTLFY